jgi:hypothetical protein
MRTVDMKCQDALSNVSALQSFLKIFMSTVHQTTMRKVGEDVAESFYASSRKDQPGIPREDADEYSTFI